MSSISDTPTPKFGEALKQQVEERLAFFETGEPPSKNAEAMRKVFEQLAIDHDESDEDGSDDEMDVDSAAAKKKSKGKKGKGKDDDEGDDEEVVAVPKKKKRMINMFPASQDVTFQWNNADVCVFMSPSFLNNSRPLSLTVFTFRATADSISRPTCHP